MKESVRALNRHFVWSFLAYAVLMGGWVALLSSEGIAQPTFTNGVSLGTYYPPNNEISGLAASRTSPGVLWAQADSGDQARFYALTDRAERLGIFNLVGATHTDWEDMAIGPGPVVGVDYVYIGDIGDNGFNRMNVQVYRIPEHVLYPRQASAPVTVDIPASHWERITLVYPGLVFFREVDAETLMVDPRNGDLYIGGKEPSVCRIFRAPAASLVNGATVTLTQVASISTNWKATGGDIQAQGGELIIRGYEANRHLWKILPGQSIADAVNGPAYTIPYRSEGQGEAVAFERNGSGYMTMSEGTSERLWHFARTSNDGPPLQYYLIAPESQWRFVDNGLDQGTAWRASAFDDSGWALGRAHLGYGEGDERTVVGYGGNASQKHATTYFRKKFCIHGGASFETIWLRAVYDSGIAVYINGTEVLRSALNPGAGFNALASDTRDATRKSWVRVEVDPALLTAGENTVAAEVHLASVSQNAMSFDLQIEGVGSPTAVQPLLSLNGASTATTQCGAPYLDPGASAVNGCGYALPATVQGTVNTNVLGNYVLTYGAMDEAGNAAIPVTRMVTVVDTTPPVIVSCVPDQTVSASPSCQGIVPAFTSGFVGADNCTPANNLVVTQFPVAGTIVPVGNTPVTVTVRDAQGNTAACTATLTAAYQGPPTATILVQPQPMNCLEGQAASFEILAEVELGTLAYQWQRFTGAAWENLMGATQRELALTGVRYEDRGAYRCLAINRICGAYEYAEPSASAMLHVAPPIMITEHPAGASLPPGGSHVMFCSASVADGELDYQWQVNTGLGFQKITGATSPSYEISSASLSDAGAYRCLVSNTLAGFERYAVASLGAQVGISTGVVYYVDPSGDNSDGLSWPTAFAAIQPAIDAAWAAGGGEVWVAGGPLLTPLAYDEARTEIWGGATGSLVMKDNVGVYGGFEGWRGGTGARETSRLQRNRARNLAVIDGASARGGLPAYHVVVFGRFLEATVNAVLDGFVITGGVASGVDGDYHTWRGGGIYNYGSSPTIANCIITGNVAAVSGGGASNEVGPAGGGDAVYINCLIHGNHANRDEDVYMDPLWPPEQTSPNPIRGGGGMFNNQSAPLVRFATFANNTVNNALTSDDSAWGVNSGGFYTWHAAPVMENSIVWSNTGSIRHDGPDAFSSTTATFCIVQGGYSGMGNLNADPMLGNAAYQPIVGALSAFVPAPGSPAVNSGDVSLTVGDDLLGVYRPSPLGSGTDRGAFELSETGPIPVCLETTVNLSEADVVDNVFLVFDPDASYAEAPLESVALEEKVFTCADIPASTLTVTVTDALGRSGSCTASVIVTETGAPTAVCNDIAVALDSAGAHTLSAADFSALAQGSMDDCTDAGELTISALPNIFDCSQAGQNVVVVVSVADASGNVDTCNARVSVQDLLPPTPPASPNSISVDLPPEGVRALRVDEAAALATGTTDNCAFDATATTVDYPAAPNGFDCADLGVQQVVLTVYDVHGNSSTGVGLVEVRDVSAPVFTGIRARTFVSSGPDFSLAMALEEVFAQDGCSGNLTNDIEVSARDMDNDAPVAFPIPANWDLQGALSHEFRLLYTVRDFSGNEIEAASILTLYAIQPPVITLLGASPAYVECGSVYADAGASAYDPESDQDITGALEVAGSVNSSVPGIYAITYAVAVPGHPELTAVSATRTVIVEDSLPPAITATGGNPLYLPVGASFVNPTTALDFCDGDLTQNLLASGIVNEAAPGIYQLLHTVSDGSGNEALPFVLTVIVVEPVVILLQSQEVFLYTTDAPVALGADYSGGYQVEGFEWLLDGVGLGFHAVADSPNTAVAMVDPAQLGPGNYAYVLAVRDEAGTTYSDSARVTVAAPLHAMGLSDITLVEGAQYAWMLTANGGLGAVHYQWLASRVGDKAFVPVTDGPYGAGAYSGSAANTLHFSPFSVEMAGLYQVEISDDFTSLVAGPAVVSVGTGLPAAHVVGLGIMVLVMSWLGLRRFSQGPAPAPASISAHGRQRG